MKIHNDRKVHKENYDVLLIGYEDWENLGLRSIAAFLVNHGLKVIIEPYKSSQIQNILTVIKKRKPKIIGFSLIFQRMLYEFADLLTYLRQNGVTAHFTMGGHFPTIEPIGTLETIPELDTVIRCEGEQTLLELFQSLEKPDLWIQIKGLVYRENGSIRINPSRPLISKLDSLPPPIRKQENTTQRGLGVSQIISSRGCHYDCSFCSIRQFYSESRGQKRRSRSPGNVVHEMSKLFYDRNNRIFIFEDDDFAINSHLQKQWIEDFIKELKREKIDKQIVWRISCRVDELDAELLKKMKEVGLMNIYIGIESGNNRSLKIYNKHYTVDDIHKQLGFLYKIKIPFEFGFMIFNPISTIETVKEDISFLKIISENSDAVIQFTKMIPYIGTPIAIQLRNERKLIGDLASPDYEYIDKKLDLMQVFFTQAFQIRNFSNNGLVERLRHAKFDSIILNKFFSDIYDTRAYCQAVQKLIHTCNSVCLEKMSLAAHFMEARTEKEIIENWSFIQKLTKEEKDMELRITSSLEHLMTYFS